MCCRVGDEKEARAYLTALANKMTEELEGIKANCSAVQSTRHTSNL